MTRLKNNHNAIDWRQELKSDPELFRGIIRQTVQEIGGSRDGRGVGSRQE